MKKIWYLFVKYYMRLGFAFYFKKLLITGVQHIPRDKAILFVSNHQNALIDPLLIGAITPRELHFLTRADLFGKPLVRALLSTVNMLPIYRIRDGLTSLSKNEEVFKKCHRIFHKGGTVLIFPEGNHNIKRRLRNLSKGFTRIIFSSLEIDPEHEIVVVPIGINYSNAKKFGSSVHIIFGPPIPVDDQHKTSVSNGASSSLKDEISDAMKKLITHVDDAEQHDKITASFREEEFLHPHTVNKKLEELRDSHEIKVSEVENQFNLLRPIVRANSILTILVWKFLYPRIKEEEFISTYRFSLGITLVPLCYFLQAGLVAYWFNDLAGILYLGMSFLIAYLYAKTN